MYQRPKGLQKGKENHEEIRRLYSEGKSVCEITRIIGITRTTVYEHIKGLPLRGQNKVPRFCRTCKKPLPGIFAQYCDPCRLVVFQKRQARLRPEEVAEIRQVYFTTDTSISSLAKQYKVTRYTIEKVINGETWKNI